MVSGRRTVFFRVLVTSSYSSAGTVSFAAASVALAACSSHTTLLCGSHKKARLQPVSHPSLVTPGRRQDNLNGIKHTLRC